MSERVLVGLIAADGGGDIGLASAAAQHPGLSICSIEAEANGPAPEAVAAVIVDAPIARRAGVLARATHAWQVPILVESPVATDREEARSLLSHLADDTRVLSANPLRYGLHTRALVDALAHDGDALETFFAAWRFRPNAVPAHALPRLVDFITALCPNDQIQRISALERQDPSVLLVTLRYAAGTLGTLELGAHLPSMFPASSELFVECFSTEHAYHCTPGHQSVFADGGSRGDYDWQPDPADTIVAAFAGWLAGDARPIGDLQRDLAALEITDRIRAAAQPGVVQGHPAPAR